jgi:hypothetical protein
VVAVARKLAVLLLTLWKNKSSYQAFPQRKLKGKNKDYRSGTIAMHRLKRLDFDNQMATFRI